MPTSYADGLRGFIIGGQKSGSTSLDWYVARHPQVWSPRGEVPAFEDPEFASGGPERLDRLLARLRGGRVAVLRRPNYLCLPEVPSRLMSAYPRTRLVAVLRDPVARSLSAYYHYMRYGLLPLVDPEVGLRRLIEDPASSDQWPRAHEVLAFGLYGEAVSRWRDVAGAEPLLVLDSDRLRNQPADVFSVVTKHLGLDAISAPPMRRVGMKGVYDMRWVRRRAAASVLLYRRSSAARLTPRGILPGLWDRVEGRLVRGSGAPSLSISLHDELRSWYRSDVLLLNALLGSDTPAWARTYA